MEDFLAIVLVDDTCDLPNIVISNDHRQSNFSYIAYDIHTGEVVMGYNGTSYVFNDRLSEDQRNTLTIRLITYITKRRNDD